ncbi:MAG: hypothetical protein ROR55_19815 [Devosia sp.]
MQIYTSCWFEKFPPPDQFLRISISRGTPRNAAAGFKKMPELAPGPWFRTVDEDTYLNLFNKQLAELDPIDIVNRIVQVAAGRDVALLCYERPKSIAAGKDWCHRHHVAAWINSALDECVSEYGYPDLDPWVFHRKVGACVPRYVDGKPAGPDPADITPYVGRFATVREEVWTVVGVSEHAPGQALIRNASGREVSVSQDILKRYFSSDQGMLT